MAATKIRIEKKEKQKVSEQISCLTSEKSRKRAYVSLLALEVLRSYMNTNGIDVDTNFCCHKNILFLDEFDVADLKVGNLKIDVRAVIGENYPELWIPKFHQHHGLLADIYVGVKISDNLNKAEIIGFFESKNLNTFVHNKNYFIVDKNNLKPIDEIKIVMETLTPKSHLYLAAEHLRAHKLFLSYIENTITTPEKELFVTHIAYCENCRKEFYDFYNLDQKLRSVENKEELSSDLTLSLFAGDPAFVGEEAAISVEPGETESIEEIMGEDAELDDLPNDSDMAEEIQRDRENSDLLNKINDVLKPPESSKNFEILNETDEENEEELEKLDALCNYETYEDYEDYQPIKESIPEAETKKVFKNLANSLKNPNLFTADDDFNIGPLPIIALEDDFDFLKKSYQNNKDEQVCFIDGRDFLCTDDINSSSKTLPELGGKLLPLDEDDVFGDDSPFTSMDMYDDQVRAILDNLDDVEVIDYVDEFAEDSTSDQNIQNKVLETNEEIKTEFKAENIQPESEPYQPVENIAVSIEEIAEIQPKVTEEVPADFRTEVQNFEIREAYIRNMFRKTAITVGSSFFLVCLIFTVMDNDVIKHFLNRNNPPVVPNTSTSPNVNPSPSTPANQAQNTHPQTPANNANNSKDQHPTDKKEALPPHKNVNDVLTKAFMQGDDEIKISSISWEVGSSLANNPIFKNYLIVTGQTFKTALSKALLTAKEKAKSDHIKIKLKLDLNGNIQETIIKQSSGSKQIDDIILQTLKEILSYTKLPKIKTNKTYIKVGIMINL